MYTHSKLVDLGGTQVGGRLQHLCDCLIPLYGYNTYLTHFTTSTPTTA